MLYVKKCVTHSCILGAPNTLGNFLFAEKHRVGENLPNIFRYLGVPEYFKKHYIFGMFRPLRINHVCGTFRPHGIISPWITWHDACLRRGGPTAQPMHKTFFNWNLTWLRNSFTSHNISALFAISGALSPWSVLQGCHPNRNKYILNSRGFFEVCVFVLNSNSIARNILDVCVFASLTRWIPAMCVSNSKTMVLRIFHACVCVLNSLFRSQNKRMRMCLFLLGW